MVNWVKDDFWPSEGNNNFSGSSLLNSNNNGSSSSVLNNNNNQTNITDINNNDTTSLLLHNNNSSSINNISSSSSFASTQQQQQQVIFEQICVSFFQFISDNIVTFFIKFWHMLINGGQVVREDLKMGNLMNNNNNRNQNTDVIGSDVETNRSSFSFPFIDIFINNNTILSSSSFCSSLSFFFSLGFNWVFNSLLYDPFLGMPIALRQSLLMVLFGMEEIHCHHHHQNSSNSNVNDVSSSSSSDVAADVNSLMTKSSSSSSSSPMTQPAVLLMDINNQTSSRGGLNIVAVDGSSLSYSLFCDSPTPDQESCFIIFCITLGLLVCYLILQLRFWKYVKVLRQ